jgi:hypothetical protein
MKVTRKVHNEIAANRRRRAAAKAGGTKKTTTRKPAKKATPAKTAPKRAAKERDPRLPAVGSKLTRTFKGKSIMVDVTADGFRYEGKTFTSISAVARHIVGYMISGPVFFKLVEPKRPEAK